MDIKYLKECIENKKVDNSLIIFGLSDSDFVARQYIHEIAKIHNLEIEPLDDISQLLNTKKSMWDSEPQKDSLKVITIDELTEIPQKAHSLKNVIIIARKIEKSVQDAAIVKIPKLESWQVKEYAYSIAGGVDKNKLDWFLEYCDYNIYRVDNELSKLSGFTKEQQKYLFDDMLSAGLLSDIPSISTFDITNAICTRDLKTIGMAIANYKSLGINEMGVLALLINSFKNIVCVQMSRNPDLELKHLTSKQIYAIKKNCGHYSNEKLKNILRFLYSIDYKIKSGELETSMMFEYIVDKILTM